MNLTDTIAIIEALAEGVDPLTGEVLPDRSLYIAQNRLAGIDVTR